MNITKKPHIASLDGVRVIAMGGIFLAHCGIISLGAWGVSMFIVLSGFLQEYVYYLEELKCSFIDCFQYSYKHIKKLYLLHIVTMLLAFWMYNLNWGTGNLFVAFHAIEDKMLCNVMLMQAWIPDNRGYFSLNGVSWYLSTMAFLYFVFPYFHKLIKNVTNVRFLIAIGCVTYVAMIGLAYYINTLGPYYLGSRSFVHWGVYISPMFRCIDFFIGVVFGRVFIFSHKEEWARLFSLYECVALFLLFVCGIYICKLNVQWLNLSILYTPLSVLAVFVFAFNEGIFSKVLSGKVMGILAQISPYFFLIHQLVIFAIKHERDFLNIVWLHGNGRFAIASFFIAAGGGFSLG